MSQNNTESAQSAPGKGIKARLKLPKGRRSRIILGMGITALLLALALPFYLHAISHESTDDAFVEAHVVSMSPRVAGHVARVLVEDNQLVKEGDLLAELDPRDFQVALEAARARLRSAQAAVTEAQAKASAAQNVLAQKEAGLSSQHAGLAQVQAEVAEVRAGYERDENDLDRMRKIVEAGAVSRQEFDHVKAQEAMTRAKLNSAKRQVDTHSAEIRQARATVAAAEDELRQAYAQVDIRTAELHEAEAEVEQAELNLSYTRITAPCAGHVTKKAVEPGTYVQVGQKLFSIVSPDVWVVANFKETQLADIASGQPVDIEVDAYPDVTFHGHVDSIQRGTGSRFTLLPPENATGNFIKVVQRIPVKIVLDASEADKNYVLAPGMSVMPSVDISEAGGAGSLRAEGTSAQAPAAR
ncbi:HlyD family secretion protein [Paucidesulfovibrio longus]|uniref:HlyD family secretion protein n=1 Tax=Paucidesulfovibrio longus TaxID=889 RepID=UPI0003B68756|nr:HlyD family secretion protein [Paucidesulfovibrio longus]